MRKIAWQTIAAIAIAAVTTVTTTVFTSYLLARPWCIQIESEYRQRILYGSNQCSAEDAASGRRELAQRRTAEGTDQLKYH